MFSIRPLQTRALAALVVAFLPGFVDTASAATRPVSIGANANFEQNLSLSAHLGWARMDLLWSEINPQPGVWNFTNTDNRINFAVAQGQQILAILHRPPTWVGGGPNENIPPLTTVQWSEFVRRVAQRYKGKIAAYEIWNEPDQKSTSKVGIGWGRNIEEPPLYVDFVRAAAIEIRTQAPGTLVVAPSFQSRNDSDGTDNRKKRILEQIQAAVYPDGSGPSFVDVISFHNNAGDSEGSLTMAGRLYFENLGYVENRAPALRFRPVWVTEYGWRSNAVGESGQRHRICYLTKSNYTGLETFYGWTRLDTWDVRRAFIYVLKSASESSSIFRADNSPKPVVTQYLQKLAYPALQSPGDFYAYPACDGTAFAASEPFAEPGPVDDLEGRFALLGLGDPRGALPAGYEQLYYTASPSEDGFDVVFAEASGGYVSIVVSPRSRENEGRRHLTDAGLQWTTDRVHVAVSGMRNGLPQGKRLLRAIGAAIDPDLDRVCLIESIRGSGGTAARFGILPPRAPEGYVVERAVIEYTRPTAACAAEGIEHAPTFDFTWRLAGADGAVLRAGAYRYPDGFHGAATGPASRQWSGIDGTRYWVAAEGSAGDTDPAILDALAASMDAAFVP